MTTTPEPPPSPAPPPPRGHVRLHQHTAGQSATGLSSLSGTAMMMGSYLADRCHQRPLQGITFLQ